VFIFRPIDGPTAGGASDSAGTHASQILQYAYRIKLSGFLRLCVKKLQWGRNRLIAVQNKTPRKDRQMHRLLSVLNALRHQLMKP
jgi:hypothetical protein